MILDGLGPVPVLLRLPIATCVLSGRKGPVRHVFSFIHVHSLFPGFLHWCLLSRLFESVVPRVHLMHKRMPDSF